ncbi:solute carrier family 2, facilitated glucose transporter member 1 [Megalops cyprinoides]|uniref:solute carrier family 2, facilitated glucose transporter member 1 n=1 Tax=Megalops cyprinoides TaxID=118141 RepID=UPI001864E6EC|nr:solute carrier family 2, facilitated glucose transporter member 1 [Megalops cyprinoides]
MSHIEQFCRGVLTAGAVRIKVQTRVLGSEVTCPEAKASVAEVTLNTGLQTLIENSAGRWTHKVAAAASDRGVGGERTVRGGDGTWQRGAQESTLMGEGSASPLYTQEEKDHLGHTKYTQGLEIGPRSTQPLVSVCVHSTMTAVLVTSIVATVLGSLQIGYHTGNVNAPAKIIEEFFNVTWRARHNTSMPDQSLTFLWSLSVSIKDFGALLGSLGVKGLADSFGRRNSILIVNALSVVGSCLMFVSKVSESFEVLIIGRLVFGLFCGLVMSLNPLYIQEVSPTELRGAFATLNQVSFATGILLGMVVGLDSVLGTEKYWALMFSLSLVPALLQYMALPFCPESPRYLLINRGKDSQAETALRRLRGNSDKVLNELKEIKEEASHTQSGVTVRQFLMKRSYRQPIIIVLIINLGSQLAGFNAIINYSTKMFSKSGFAEAKYLTLGVGAVNVTFTIVAFFMVERAGRRKLLLTGFFSLALCNLLMTITDSILHIVPDLRSLQVLVVFFLISAYEVGPGPISWFIGAELFDQPARPIAMAFTSMLNWGGKFLLALLFPPLLKVCGAYVYLLFMMMAIMAFSYTLLRLPETRGRTFDDIAAEFRGAEGIPLHNKTSFNTFN